MRTLSKLLAPHVKKVVPNTVKVGEPTTVELRGSFLRAVRSVTVEIQTGPGGLTVSDVVPKPNGNVTMQVLADTAGTYELAVDNGWAAVSIEIEAKPARKRKFRLYNMLPAEAEADPYAVPVDVDFKTRTRKTPLKKPVRFTNTALADEAGKPKSLNGRPEKAAYHDPDTVTRDGDGKPTFDDDSLVAEIRWEYVDDPASQMPVYTQRYLHWTKEDGTFQDDDDKKPLEKNPWLDTRRSSELGSLRRGNVIKQMEADALEALIANLVIGAGTHTVEECIGLGQAFVTPLTAEREAFREFESDAYHDAIAADLAAGTTSWLTLGMIHPVNKTPTGGTIGDFLLATLSEAKG